MQVFEQPKSPATLRLRRFFPLESFPILLFRETPIKLRKESEAEVVRSPGIRVALVMIKTLPASIQIAGNQVTFHLISHLLRQGDAI